MVLCKYGKEALVLFPLVLRGIWSSQGVGILSKSHLGTSNNTGQEKCNIMRRKHAFLPLKQETEFL